MDPVSASRLDPRERRTVQKRVEIYLHSGGTKAASEIYREQTLEARFDETLIFWVWSEKEALKKRLDMRVDKMIQGGLESEVRELKKVADRCGLPLTSGVFQSIGMEILILQCWGVSFDEGC